MISFTEELHSWQEIPLAGNESAAGKIEIVPEFPDPEGLLETAYAFLKRLKAPAFTVITKQEKTTVFEEYEISLSPGKCEISANDTEGIRRGIYKTAEYLRAFTPEQFPILKKLFTPQLKTRISRYRFMPLNHTEMKHELEEDSDFYPEPFLDRFASEGINAVWFNAHGLKDFTLTKWHPDDAEEKQRKYAKLQDIVNRCRRYGIKVFPYHVIPESVSYDAEPIAGNPDMRGPVLYGHPMLCMASRGFDYLKESFHQLFNSVKNLGGFLMIVEGEGAAICPELVHKGNAECHKRCGLSGGEIYAKLFEAVNSGIKSASPDAELIAWYYLPFVTKLSEYHEEAVRRSPEDIIFQFNAESGSFPVQLGKPRRIGDYWQCITEPSPTYKEFSGYTRKHNRRLSAKIQVGTSHEVGSIPYVPVPALTYRKYKKLQELGTTDVMQCWGTGGTPGLMNFTAGRLAFTDCSNVSEEEFISDLANTFWGKENAPAVIKAWTIFSDTYEQNYPYANMIQYFGPIADGVNWPLYAYPAYVTLRPTWGMNDGIISGDNICECLNNHTLDEIVLLLNKLSSDWMRGIDLLKGLGDSLREDLKRETIRAEALGIQFSSAAHIMEFYQMRRDVFKASGDRNAKIRRMKELVELEITARERMIELVRLEPVLGYNPEAGGHKYNEETIRAGLDTMPKVKAELARLESGDLSYPKIKVSYRVNGSKIEMENMSWSAVIADNTVKIHVDCAGIGNVLDEVFFAFDDDGETFPIHAHFDHTGRVFIAPEGTDIDIRHTETGWLADITIPTEVIPGWATEYCRFNISRQFNTYQKLYSWPGVYEGPVITHLGLAFYNPAEMGYFLLPDFSPR